MKVIITKQLNHKGYGEKEVVAMVDSINDAYAYFHQKMADNALVRETIDYGSRDKVKVSLYTKAVTSKGYTKSYFIDFIPMHVWTPSK